MTTQTQITRTREQMHRAIQQLLVTSGMSTPSARVTADGYLYDLERTNRLKLRGLGQVRRVGADHYELTPEVPGEHPVRQQVDGRPAQPELQGEAAFEQAVQVFMARGTPEVLARSAANAVVHFRQGNHRKRVD
ncbi:hypothetical protein DESA109040_02280 [Deinococcus saxicola]|uniref:hypothetical protein n=1 Tax=Deinococcus saxicola TaxID=249406 RepID=UPI0039F14189